MSETNGLDVNGREPDFGSDEPGITPEQRKHTDELAKALWIASERVDGEQAKAASKEERMADWRRVKPRYLRIARHAIRRLAARGYVLEPRKD